MNQRDYIGLINKALIKVVRTILQNVQKSGIEKDKHFFISFYTTVPGVFISDELLSKFPNSLTIVLQNQFNNLIVSNADFKVNLYFGGVSQTLRIPFTSIKYFSNPSAKLNLDMYCTYKLENCDIIHEKDKIFSKNNTESEEKEDNVIYLDKFLNNNK